MSNRGPNLADLKRYLVEHTDAADIPVFAIMFGDASPDQLKEIADTTSGRVFDGRTDLVRAFREARGYN
jgi:Ca-activated chloride channel family protein